MARIAITGSSGLVGSHLADFLLASQHDVIRIVRRSPAKSELRWDPANQYLDISGLEGMDAVVHLAGENIGDRRWNARQKQRILESRNGGTQLLCESLAKLSRKPPVLVSASAIGYYGDRGDEICDEAALPGTGFLPDVCVAWEAATAPAVQAGIRVVNMRIGVVLSRAGGALTKMLLPFRLGVGGVVGNGKQYWSWITLVDLIRAIDYCREHDHLHGPVNAVAPHPVTNTDFTKALGRVLHRPTVFPMPAFAARLALGEMADALLLASTRVVPKKLLDSGFAFEAADIESGLRRVLG